MFNMSESQLSSKLNQRHIDWGSGTVTNGGAASATLRPQSLSVLKFLAERPGAVVAKDELMAAIWPGIAVTDDSLVQCVTEIRKALGDDAHMVIKTVPKRGYVFEAGVRAAGPGRRNWHWLAAALCGVFILAAALFIWPSANTPAPREPSIAVLPFVNMSGDPAQDHLGPGIAEDIITMLSSYPTLRVVSRTSSFVYDKPVKVQEVGQDLNVNYVIEGSVRRAGEKVRVSAQLIDAATGDHVWADRYDEEGGDVATLQNAVADQIYNTLAGFRGEIQKKEMVESWNKSGPGLAEYDYMQRGHQLWFRFTKEDNAKARAIWQEGLAKFPNSAVMRAKVGISYWVDVDFGWSDDPWRDTELAWKFAKEAEAIQNKSRLAAMLTHCVLAWTYQRHEGDFERSAIEAEAGVALIPHDPWMLNIFAGVMVNTGRTDQAIAWMEEALRRDASPTDTYFGNLALAYYFANRPADAVTQFQKMRDPWKTNLAAAYVRLGNPNEARALIAKHLEEVPDWSLQKEAVYPTGKQPQYAKPLLDAYLADLAKAGLPE
jgi:adenylate cyclase